MKAVLALTLLTTAHRLVSSAGAGGKVRKYYIAALETEWDYAPRGNLVSDDPAADTYIKSGPGRIGSKYAKVLFRGFTDETFRTQIPHPPLLGHIGPVIRAEVGDTIMVYLKNLALTSGRNFSIHPHGVLYDKRSEGAMYNDRTTWKDKFDDGIPPGRMHVYNWTIPESFAPTEDDENCLAWPYHSHRDSERDIATGLVGMLFVCRRGILRDDGTRKDVDKELVLYLDEIAETASFVFEKSLRRCVNPSRCRQLFKEKNPDFLASNRMFSMNGYVYGNLPRFEVFPKESVAIHLFSLYEDITNFYISGQTLRFRNHRKSSLTFMVGSSLTATLVAENSGTYLMSCMITPRHKAGMDAFIHILPAPTRTYYIAAEKRIWDYAPSGRNLFLGGSFSDPKTKGRYQHVQADNRIGRRYIKCVYIEYTDKTFTHRKYRSYDEYHLGCLGPVIRAEVGDTIKVVFKNNADRPYSILPHGVTFTKENEGLRYKNPDTGEYTGKIAQPGQTVTYIWNVPWDTAAPTDDDAPCLVHTYHSGVDTEKDLQTGLVGPLLICKKGHDKKFNKERFSSQDREFFLFFLTSSETESWYIDENIARFAGRPSSVDKNDRAFIAANKMTALNGYTWSNMPGLNMRIGDRVTWYVFGLGTFNDLHVIHIFGQVMTYDGNHVQSKTIQPGTGLTLTANPQLAGQWALVCPSHLKSGMMATFKVFPSPHYSPPFKTNPHGRTRVYYIAAVEVEWEYADRKTDPVENTTLLGVSHLGYIFVKDDDKFIGSKYRKAVYREYTDYTFTREVPRGPEDEHLGVLGPTIRAEVGDTVYVVFKNMASRPYSIHPQGLFYRKDNEGASYRDGSSASRDDSVAPGQVYVYSWEVPPRSGPGPNDPNCISWIYYSATDLVKDAQTGLVGTIVACRKGTLDHRNKRKDVDREFSVMFLIFDENKSWYLEQNIQKYAPNRRKQDKKFGNSNLMFSVNGKIFANLKGLVMKQDDLVDWHLFGWGTYNDVHPIHFHGQTMVLHTDKRHRVDVIELAPTITETVEMLANNPGTWIIHCHDGRHIARGMEAVYTIQKKDLL